MTRTETSQIISGAFYNWLQAEVETSGGDRNEYLNDFEEMRRRLTLGYEHPDNWAVTKHQSHMDRYPVWWEAFALDPSDDYQSARILFNALMQVSGMYRDQCYIQASDQEDYLARRAKIVGINPQQPVALGLRVLVPETGDFSLADLEIESLDERRKEAMVIGELAVKKMCERLFHKDDLGAQDSVSVRETMSAQYSWLSFATDCVVLAAKIRKGELGAVPFLEAKSISDDPKVIYPLAT